MTCAKGSRAGGRRTADPWTLGPLPGRASFSGHSAKVHGFIVANGHNQRHRAGTSKYGSFFLDQRGTHAYNRFNRNASSGKRSPRRDRFMPNPSADCNLLLGILALQMDFIDRDALIAAMHAWVLDKSRP